MFDDDSSSPSFNKDTGSDCYSTKLASAIPQNIKYLEKFVNRTSASKGSQYIPAFKKAFSFFHQDTQLQGDREQIILFVSDGDPSDNHTQILQTIVDENRKLSNKVVIHTFGFGITNQVDQTMNQGDPRIKLLQDIADQKSKRNIAEADMAPRGDFLHVRDNNPDELRQFMTKFYTPSYSGDTVVFTGREMWFNFYCPFVDLKFLASHWPMTGVCQLRYILYEVYHREAGR